MAEAAEVINTGEKISGFDKRFQRLSFGFGSWKDVHCKLTVHEMNRATSLLHARRGEFQTL
jgi:hypothetical protein